MKIFPRYFLQKIYLIPYIYRESASSELICLHDDVDDVVDHSSPHKSVFFHCVGMTSSETVGGAMGR